MRLRVREHEAAMEVAKRARKTVAGSMHAAVVLVVVVDPIPVANPTKESVVPNVVALLVLHGVEAAVAHCLVLAVLCKPESFVVAARAMPWPLHMVLCS